jgi:hypothetical protein
MKHPNDKQVREAFDVCEPLLELGKNIEHTLGFMFSAAAFWYLGSFGIRAANESDGLHLKHKRHKERDYAADNSTG